MSETLKDRAVGVQVKEIRRVTFSLPVYHAPLAVCPACGATRWRVVRSETRTHMVHDDGRQERWQMRECAKCNDKRSRHWWVEPSSN